jgi:hypothetical protein
MMRKHSGLDLGMDSMAAATSAAMTLWHRLPMFGWGSVATAAERQAEATRMVNEKAAAFVAGCIDANLELMRICGAAAMGRFGPTRDAPVTLARAGLRPAFRKVKANAKRLNRRAVSRAAGR